MQTRAFLRTFALGALLAPLPLLAQQYQEQRTTLECEINGLVRTFNVYRRVTIDPENETFESEIGPWFISIFGDRELCQSDIFQRCCEIAGAYSPDQSADITIGGTAPSVPKAPKPKPKPLPPEEEPEEQPR